MSEALGNAQVGDPFVAGLESSGRAPIQGSRLSDALGTPFFRTARYNCSGGRSSHDRLDTSGPSAIAEPESLAFAIAARLGPDAMLLQ